MGVERRVELEELAQKLQIDLETWLILLDESEVEDNGFRKARIHLLGALDGMFETGKLDADTANTYYGIIGFTKQEMSGIRQNANLDEVGHRGS